jgi:PAS domain S-box-containing protein
MERLIAAKDWSQTRLGAAETWSDALTLSTHLILASGFPMAIRWGPDLVTIYNDAYAPILGDKHPHALGNSLAEVWPEIYAELGPLNLSILRGEREPFFEKNHLWKIRRRDGALEDAYFTISYSPIPDPTAPNGIGGVLVTAMETSEDIHREHLFRRLNTHLEHEVEEHIRERDRIWDVSEDLLGVSNFEGYFESVNPAWTNLLGWSADEIKRKHVSELRHPDDAPASVAQRERLANGVATVRMENRFRHKDGSWRWLSWTLTAEKGRIYVIGRHITAEKDAAERLRESEGQFRLLVDAVTDYALFKLTPDGYVSSWNSGAQRIKGYRAEEIIGQHFSRFYTPEDQRAAIPSEALRTAAAEGRYEIEGWRVRKDGTRFWANVVIDAIRENDSLAGFVKITRDITERRESQIALQRTQEQLAQAQKMDALGQLTGGIAHDFNNMLMVVGRYTQFLKGRLVDAKDRRAIEAIEAATTRAENLTRQLLTFSRRQPLSAKNVKLAECLQGFKEVLTATASGTGSGKVHLDIKIPAGLWPVRIDPNEFEMALINILVNARDAMTGGGTICLSAHNTVLGTDERSPRLKGEFVAVEVRDDGVGIPPEILSKVFEPFFTTKESGKGTGLGLSQVYGFAHQAGGTVTVASEVGHGTTVTLFLPRAKRRTGGTARETALELPGGDGR